MAEAQPRGVRPAGVFDFERHGERIAIRCEDGTTVSYRDLAVMADELARGFGTSRKVVVIESEIAIEPLAAYLGAIRAGHVVLPVSAETPVDRLADIVARYQVGGSFRSKGGAWVAVQETTAAPALHPDLALLLSTSGSTGSGKLVRLSRSAVEANAASIAAYLAIDPEDRAATTLPFHYSYGLSVVHSHLLAGATLLLSDRSVVDPAFRAFVEAAGVTSIAGVPYTYELLERGGFRDAPPPTLRTMTQAGGRLPADIARRYAEWSADRDIRFFVMYGQTEATARMAYMPPDLLADHPDRIGVAIPGGTFKLVDPQGVEIDAPGVTGELVYSGPNVMMGYALDVPDLARPAESDTLRTGDLAERNEAGLYRVVGRLSRFIKPFGVRIELDQVEAMLRDRGITAAAAGDDSLLAVLLVEEKGSIDVGEEADRLASDLRLPLSALHVSTASSLPRLASGKPDYPRILADARRDRASDEQTPGNDVKALFAGAFPRATLSDEASFVSLGGDSLNYVTVSTALEGALGRLPARWEELTIAELRRLSDATPPARRGWWQVRWVEPELLIRALAILAVVVNHASDNWVVGGGANVLLMLFGYNLSRYSLSRLTSGHGWDVARNFGLRIMLPYCLFLLAWMVAKRDLDVPSLLLVSNYTGRFGSLMEPYWFLETVYQLMLAIVIAFSIPAIRRLAARRPWEVGLTVVAAGLVLALALNALWPRPELQNRTPEMLLWLVGLGWSIHRVGQSTGRRAVAVAVVLFVLMIGYFHPLGAELSYPDGPSQRLWFAASCLLILFVSRLPLPAVLAGLAAGTAGASFYIYLTHVVPIHVLRYVLHVRHDGMVVLAALVPGAAIWFALKMRRAEQSAVG